MELCYIIEERKEILRKKIYQIKFDNFNSISLNSSSTIKSNRKIDNNLEQNNKIIKTNNEREEIITKENLFKNIK